MVIAVMAVLYDVSGFREEMESRINWPFPLGKLLTCSTCLMWWGGLAGILAKLVILRELSGAEICVCALLAALMPMMIQAVKIVIALIKKILDYCTYLVMR